MRQFSKIADQKSYPFILPDLPYHQNDLAPHLCDQTLEYHHKKHHQAYVTNLNNLLLNNLELQHKSLEEIILISAQNNLTAVFNNAAQVWNHTFYWHCMKKGGGNILESDLYKQICQDFGDFASFVAKFKQEGLNQFGSGWVWLVLEAGKLSIVKTPNAQLPITKNQFPILTCDVWEHAYYIGYRNSRAQYLEVFMESLINWEFVEMNFVNAQQ